MNNLKYILAVTLFLVSGVSYAQFDDLLKSIQKEVENVTQDMSSTSGSQNQPQKNQSTNYASTNDLANEMEQQEKQKSNNTKNISDRYGRSIIYSCNFRSAPGFKLSTKYFVFLDNAVKDRTMGCDPGPHICVLSSSEAVTPKNFPDDRAFLVGEWNRVEISGKTYSWTTPHGGDTKQFQLKTDTSTLYYKFNEVEKFDCKKIK